MNGNKYLYKNRIDVNIYNSFRFSHPFRRNSCVSYNKHVNLLKRHKMEMYKSNYEINETSNSLGQIHVLEISSVSTFRMNSSKWFEMKVDELIVKWRCVQLKRKRSRSILDC